MSTSPPGMRGKALAGASFLGAGQALKIGLTFCSTIILARLLTPEDFGLIAMTATVTGFLMMFQNVGLDQAIIQARRVEPDHLDALFWTGAIFSALVALAIAAAAPFAAQFYGDERIRKLMFASSMLVVLGSFNLVQFSLLNREMRFGALSLIDIAANILSFIVAISAAFVLRSYWAIWLGNLAAVLLNVIAAFSLVRWLPRRGPSLHGVGELWKFARGLAGFNIVNFIARNLDNVLIGRFSGAVELGIYDRAYRLMLFPLQNFNAPLSRVMLPMLARLADEPARYRRAYLLALQLIQMATVPGIAVAGAASGDLIPLLLGAKWRSAAAIFYWLSLSAILQSVFNTTGWLFISSHRTGALFRWGLFSCAVTAVGFAIGVHWGGVGVAVAYLCCNLGFLPVLTVWATRGTPVNARDLIVAMAPSFTAAGATWLGVTLALPHLQTVPLLVVSLMLAYALNLLAHLTTFRGREALSVIVETVNRGLPRVLRRVHAAR